MQRIGTVLICLGPASLGVGLFALLDAYWRWIGVALGYPPFLSGLVGGGLLLFGLSCLVAGQQARWRVRPGCSGVPDAKPAGLNGRP
jgi:hypothetical protein